MTSISPSSRPFGILCNSVLPLRIGKVFYPTIDHYRMAMMLTKAEDRAAILSYPNLFEARLVFNRLDEAQYVTLVRESCDEFFRKRLRTDDDFRRHLAEHWHFDYLLGDHSPIPMKKIVGIASDGEGYNVIGQSLETLSRTLDRKKKNDIALPYLLEKDSPPIKNRDKVMVAAAKANQPTKIEKVVTAAVHEPVKAAVPLAFLQEDEEEDSEEEDEPLEMPAEAVDPELVEVDAVFDKPEKKKAMRIYTVEEECDWSPSKNKEWHDTVNPILAYKIYRITEFLIGEIKKGFDIARYAGRPLDEIIMHTGACPELFGLGSLPITPELRREIYVTFWDRFRARVLPHHAIVENALRYPDNLVQFIRKQYLMELNTHIGDKIRSTLFRDFLRRVVLTYPGVSESEVDKAVARETVQFTATEYASITDRLYHLFHAGRFDKDSNAAEVIRIAEVNRRTVEQIEEAARFLPSLQREARTAWNLDIDPEAHSHVKIRGKEFKNVFHYIYYRLFQVYGDLSAAEAYSNVKTGNLQEHLESIIDMRRKKMLYTALRVKFDLYSQVREMMLYIKTTSTPLEFADSDDADTAKGWRMIMTDLDPIQEAIMAFVVRSIPSASPTRFERAIFLYSFLSDFFRALKIYRNDIVGKKLDARFVDVFFRCFYHQLLRLPPSDTPVGDGFEALVRSMSVVAGTEEISTLWEKLSAYVSLFRDESFVPSTLFVASRESTYTAIENVPKLAMDALCRVLGCLFSRDPDSEIRSEDMFAVVQILSGRNDIAPWSDPSFELLQEITHEPHNPFKDLENTKIYKSLMKRVGKAKTEVHRSQYNILHPKYTCLAPLIQEELQRPHLHDPVVSRATFALDSLVKNLLHPHRLLFFV